MSNLIYFDTFDNSDRVAMYTQISSVQHSPTNLQNFYENFDPESNEECLFEHTCSTDEVPKCNGSSISNSYTSQITFNQITPQCKSSIDFLSCTSQKPLNKSDYRTEPPSRGCNHSNQIKKTITKKKRKRTTFTTDQIIAMEQIFKTRPYICREERLLLTQKLQVSEKSIKVWFQNRRRMSEKRENVYVADSPSSVDTCDFNSDRLAYIESQINDKVDQYGNVVLDDDILNELVNIIDEYLPKETGAQIRPIHIIDINKNRQSESTDILEPVVSDNYGNNIPMYEPISPASVLDEFLL